MTAYTYAPEVEEIALDLINTTHPHLAGARIEYVFRTPPAKSRGRVVLGKARKISGLAAFLAGNRGDGLDLGGGSFFVLEVSSDAWEQASHRRKWALVDHELCHMVIDEDGRPAIAGHDVEEFVAIVERHGIWKRDLDVLSLAMQAAKAYEGEEDD